MKIWNKAYMILLIKKVLAGQGSLWVAWLNSYVFKDKNFWSVEIKPSTSWCMKRLLKMRMEVHQLLSTGAATASSIWDSIREKRPTVPWQKLLWYPMHIPKYSLITLMAFLHRLPTKVRLQRMGVIIDSHCVLCSAEPESRDHLFLFCPTAASLWESIFSLSGLIFCACSWGDFMTQACINLKGKSLLSLIMKLALNTLVYLLWEERNKRLFQGRSRTVEDLLKAIKDVVRLHLKGRTFNRLLTVNFNLCNHWNITDL
ncbi:uncharacterized protein LOC120120094 [Hibiscus syriacus]|uniref:uncharacterized protein LOC120120094 n=1 Tax=Hibiscus syriacus TaxID=106335 RepID=UPI0019206718|nr:uncharacterized protein LOC120120094 [Hibiscus syriacus]